MAKERSSRTRERVVVAGERSARYAATFRRRVQTAGPALTPAERAEALALFGRLGLQARLENGLAGLRVLECGCGSGWFSIWMAAEGGAVVTAVDVREEALDETWARALAEGVADRLEVRLTSLLELDLADETFDLVVGRLVLHHGDVEQAAREIRRVLATASGRLRDLRAVADHLGPSVVRLFPH